MKINTHLIQTRMNEEPKVLLCPYFQDMKMGVKLVFLKVGIQKWKIRVLYTWE